MVLSLECPGMGNLSGSKDGIAWTQIESLFTNLQKVLTFNGVKPLFLLIVEVTRGAALFFIKILYDEKTTVGILRCNL